MNINVHKLSMISLKIVLHRIVPQLMDNVQIRQVFFTMIYIPIHLLFKSSKNNIQFEYFTGIPDIFTKVAGPFSVIGLETEALGAHFYANIEDLEIELEPGQVIGVEGVQIGYK